MYETIEQFLDALKDELKDDGSALAQDALADTRAQLSMALEAACRKTPDVSVSDAMKSILAEHGSPQETAAAYRAAQHGSSPSIQDTATPPSVLGKFFGAYIDPRTWRAFVFMLLSFVTGIVYFTWAVTGLSLSVSLLVLVIGAPFAILFLLSVRGLGWLEARLVEVLLDVRMERRPLFPAAALNWLQRSKALLADKRTWLSLLYLVLQMPLGLIYFTMLVMLFAASLALLAAPFVQVWMHFAVITIDGGPLFLSPAALALLEIGGFILLTATMHLIRGVGGWHGRYAKALLVS